MSKDSWKVQVNKQVGSVVVALPVFMLPHHETGEEAATTVRKMFLPVKVFGTVGRGSEVEYIMQPVKAGGMKGKVGNSKGRPKKVLVIPQEGTIYLHKDSPPSMEEGCILSNYFLFEILIQDEHHMYIELHWATDGATAAMMAYKNLIDSLDWDTLSYKAYRVKDRFPSTNLMKEVRQQEIYGIVLDRGHALQYSIVQEKGL